jgi:hypothetical protein
MSHERLIVTLASQAAPVQPLPAPRVRMARWLLLVAVAVGLAIAWRGLRANLAAAISDPTFIVTNLLILMVALSSAWLALTLAVPERCGRRVPSGCRSPGSARGPPF